MDVPLYNLDGTTNEAVPLPSVFETPHRPDLISTTAVAMQANATQPYGSDDYAGLRTSAESFGSGRGLAHVPRSNNRGKRVPQTVGGRRAHPPKPAADRGKDLNDQERQLATRSALAATADVSLVAERGHVVDDELDVPVVLGDDFESLEKTQAVVGVLEAIGLAGDVDRADQNRGRRAGRGTTRGRARTEPTSILFVTSDEAGPSRAARNLPGVDVATASNVSVLDLAPGGHPGRLTVFTETALAEVGER